MKTLKNRVLRLKLHDRTSAEIAQMLKEIDETAYILWTGYDLFNLIQTAFFRNINLADSSLNYYTELVVRYDNIFDNLTISFKKQCKNA